MSTIFKCALCNESYNKDFRFPISLPCGDVFCSECIKAFEETPSKGIRCPRDKTVHYINVEDMPICYQILNFLPEVQRQPLMCLRHPKKKIEFVCKNHTMFLCSICIKEHNNHNISCFKMEPNEFTLEVQRLSNQIEEEKKKFFDNKTQYHQIQSYIEMYIQEQIKEVECYYDKLMSVIQCKKHEIIEQFVMFQENKKKQFNEYSNITNNIRDKFVDIQSSLHVITKDYLPRGEYENFYTMRMKINKDIKDISNTDDIHNDKLPKFVYNSNANDDVLGRIEWSDNALQGNAFNDTWTTANWANVKQQVNVKSKGSNNNSNSNSNSKLKDKAIKLQELSNIYLTRSPYNGKKNTFKKDNDKHSSKKTITPTEINNDDVMYKRNNVNITKHRTKAHTIEKKKETPITVFTKNDDINDTSHYDDQFKESMTSLMLKQDYSTNVFSKNLLNESTTKRTSSVQKQNELKLTEQTIINDFTKSAGHKATNVVNTQSTKYSSGTQAFLFGNNIKTQTKPMISHTLSGKHSSDKAVNVYSPTFQSKTKPTSARKKEYYSLYNTLDNDDKGKELVLSSSGFASKHN